MNKLLKNEQNIIRILSLSQCEILTNWITKAPVEHCNLRSDNARPFQSFMTMPFPKGDYNAMCVKMTEQLLAIAQAIIFNNYETTTVECVEDEDGYFANKVIYMFAGIMARFGKKQMSFEELKRVKIQIQKLRWLEVEDWDENSSVIVSDVNYQLWH